MTTTQTTGTFGAMPPTPAYTAGQQAFHAGQSADDNPHVLGLGGYNKARQWWFDGFFDARIQTRLGAILEKYGLTWP